MYVKRSRPTSRSVLGKRKRSSRPAPRRTKMRSIARKQIMAFKETKKQTITVSSSAITTSDAHSSSTNWTIGQGDTSVTREGNEVYATSFYHKFMLRANTTGSNTSFIRLVLYMPRHDKDDSITNLTVLNSVDTDKFKVLYDRTIELGFSSGHAFGGKVLTVKRKFKKPAKLYYTSANASAPISPTMKWVWVSDQGANEKPPTLEAILTNYFKD